jgi:hypothetical protein
MNTRWFLPEHNRDPKLKHDFEAALVNSTVLTNRFLQILEDMEQELYKYEGDLTNYTDGWASKQAFINGKRKQLRDIKLLFNFG